MKKPPHRIKSETFFNQHVKLAGELKAKQGLWIDGEFTGRIESAGGVRIGPTAHVKADVQVHTLISAGVLRGKITAEEVVQLALPGSFEGELQAAQLSVEQGFQLKGPFQVTQVAHKSSSSNQRTNQQAPPTEKRRT